MQDTMIFYKKNGAIVTAVLGDNNRLKSINIEEAENQFKIGNIFVGHVTKVLFHLNACYVDIGMSKHCYMELKKDFKYLTDKDHPDGQIHVGDEVMVQIIKEPMKTKPATVSPEISINSRMVLVKYDCEGKITFSSKITSKAFKKKLKDTFNGKVKENQSILFRTASENATIDEIIQDYSLCQAKLDLLINTYSSRKKGTLLYSSDPNYISALRDNKGEISSKIVTDDPEIFIKLKEYLENYQPEHVKNLNFYSDKVLSLESLYDMRRNMSELATNKVWLKSGACLIIDKTEALTVIDVNSAKASNSKANFKEGFLQTNIEAAKEIFRQITLRNLSGIIIIDFINDKAHTPEDLYNSVSSLYREDPTIQVVDITKLGLIEVTRARKNKPISDIINAHKLYE